MYTEPIPAQPAKRVSAGPLGVFVRKEGNLNKRKMTSSISLAIVMLLLNACGMAKYVKLPTVKPTNVIMSDCWRSFRVAAWQDLNGDGLWDVSEPPLEGVKFDLQGPFAEITSGYPFLSKADGRLDIGAWHPGNCYNETYTITAISPESYKSTTPFIVTFSLTLTNPYYKGDFGFRAVSM